MKVSIPRIFAIALSLIDGTSLASSSSDNVHTSEQQQLRGAATAVASHRQAITTVGSVTKLRVVDADTNMPLAGYDPLGASATIDLATLPSTVRNFNIEAITTGSVGAIEWSRGLTVIRTETVAPWAFCGNSGSDFFACSDFVEGFDATITAKPMLTGQSGVVKSVQLKIIRSRPALPSFGLTLMNADSDKEIAPLVNGTVVVLSSTPRINVRANVPSSLSARSVRFWYDGRLVQTENGPTFAMFGNSGSNFFPYTPTVGCHDVRAVAYSDRDGRGLVVAVVTVNFCAVPTNPAPVSPPKAAAPVNPPMNPPMASAPVPAPVVPPVNPPMNPPMTPPVPAPMAAAPVNPPMNPPVAPVNPPMNPPMNPPLPAPMAAAPVVPPVNPPMNPPVPAPMAAAPVVPPMNPPVPAPMAAAPVVPPVNPPMNPPIPAPMAAAPVIPPVNPPMNPPIPAPMAAAPVVPPVNPPMNPPVPAPMAAAPIVPPVNPPMNPPVPAPMAAAPTVAGPVVPVSTAILKVVINEIMRDPTGFDNVREWFELFNAGPTAVNLLNWTIKDDDDDLFRVSSSFILQPGAYAIFANNADSATNGGLPYVNVTFPNADLQLGNNNDELVLIDNTGMVQDRVNTTSAAGFATPAVGGASIALRNPSLDNANGANWCLSTTTYGAGGKGTPGMANDCPVVVAPIPAPVMPPMKAPQSPIPAPLVAPMTAPKSPTASPVNPPVDAPKAPMLAPVNPIPAPFVAPMTAPKSPTASPVNPPVDAPKAPMLAPVNPPVPQAGPVVAPVAPVAPIVSILINEILFDAVVSGTDTANEWIELLNNGNVAVNLQGWKIGDFAAPTATNISSSFIISPGQYVVLSSNDDTATNGGVAVDLKYSTNIQLSNSGDSVILTDPNGIEHDRVAYSQSGFPDPIGASIALKSTTLDNSVGSSWCVSPTVWPGADNGDKGTPGAANDCPGSPIAPTAPKAPVPPIAAPKAPTAAPVTPPKAPMAPTAAAPTTTGMRIHTIQGSGNSATNVGATVTVTGIATSILTAADALGGFFLQEEDVNADTNPQTSEGIYIECKPKCLLPVSSGDKVTVVNGVVAEIFGTTSLIANVTSSSYSIVSSNNPLPTPVSVTLPATGSTKTSATFENLEGMLVTFPGTLVVSEYFELSRFGQIVLTESSRSYQFTNNNVPNVANYASFLAALEKRRIILDDDNDDQNDAVVAPASNEAYFYPTTTTGGGLSLTNKFRGGDTITGLTGVLQYSFNNWRLRPVQQRYDYTFTSVNARSVSPPSVGSGTLRVASFNVLNYFTTPDNGQAVCSPAGNADCRGANSIAELERQRAKIVAALVSMNVDIVGLIEMENSNNDVPATHLVNGLNTALGGPVYAVLPTGAIGTDAIRCGFIYKTASVSPSGAFKILDSSVDTNFIDNRNRPVLIQTFAKAGVGGNLTVAVNHFKSKGSSCTSPNPAIDDPAVNNGEGNCPITRKKAAIALASYLASDPTGSGDTDYLIIGDLNSYAKEPPITELINAGYTNLLNPTSYGYVFDGLLGSLDYALASPTLVPQVTGAAEWHINSDEIPIFDYNDGILDSGESSFERKSNALPIYAADPYRSSDHDPVIVAINLSP